MAESDHVRFGEKVLEKKATRESTSYQRKMTPAEKEAEIASAWSDEPYGVDERDYKKKQVRAVTFHRAVMHRLTPHRFSKDGPFSCMHVSFLT